MPSAPANANLALGQANLTSGGPNGGGLSAGSLSGPAGTPASDGTALYVPDTGNHRVLYWTTAPVAKDRKSVV